MSADVSAAAAVATIRSAGPNVRPYGKKEYRRGIAPDRGRSAIKAERSACLGRTNRSLVEWHSQASPPPHPAGDSN